MNLTQDERPKSVPITLPLRMMLAGQMFASIIRPILEVEDEPLDHLLAPFDEGCVEDEAIKASYRLADKLIGYHKEHGRKKPHYNRT